MPVCNRMEWWEGLQMLPVLRHTEKVENAHGVRLNLGSFLHSSRGYLQFAGHTSHDL